MFEDFKVGQYVNINSRVHSLDPRTKLWVLALCSILVIITEDWVSIGGEFLLLLLVALLTRIPWRYYANSLIVLWPVFVFTLLLNGSNFNIHPGSLLSIEFSPSGLNMGMIMVSRLSLIILLTAIFSFTTSPITLADALERLFAPFAKLGFPAHEIALMITMAIRFMPAILEEGNRLVKAVQARGGDLGKRNLFMATKMLTPLLVPLFIGTFRRADDLALAMEGRCYRGGKGRTRYRTLRFARQDYLTIATSTVIVLGIMAIRLA